MVGRQPARGGRGLFFVPALSLGTWNDEAAGTSIGPGAPPTVSLVGTPQRPPTTGYERIRVEYASPAAPSCTTT